MHPTPAPAPGILGLMASIPPRPFAVALALSFKTIPCRTWKTQKNSRNPEQAVSGYVSYWILVLDSSVLLNALLVPWTILAPSVVLVRLSVSRNVSVSWCVGGGVGRGVSFHIGAGNSPSCIMQDTCQPHPLPAITSGPYDPQECILSLGVNPLGALAWWESVPPAACRGHQYHSQPPGVRRSTGPS